MCGICGEIRFDGRSADVAAVSRMTGAMVPRGPDSDGVVAHGPVALGHRRLSIIDLSAHGAQPMVDSDLGLSLVFNGCIYNYRDLRKDLQASGYRFFSTSDSEVVIKAFHNWGPRCVDRFKGMFAFAIADRDSGVVTLARDRLGIKPLYLAALPGRLAFRVHGRGPARRRRGRHFPLSASSHESTATTLNRYARRFPTDLDDIPSRLDPE